MRQFINNLEIFAVLLMLGGIAAVTVVSAQQPVSSQDQLQQCQSLLRIKQGLPCRCDEAEQLAGTLLRRAEKAEQELAQTRQELTKVSKPEKIKEKE